MKRRTLFLCYGLLVAFSGKICAAAAWPQEKLSHPLSSRPGLTLNREFDLTCDITSDTSDVILRGLYQSTVFIFENPLVCTIEVWEILHGYGVLSFPRRAEGSFESVEGVWLVRSPLRKGVLNVSYGNYAEFFAIAEAVKIILGLEKYFYYTDDHLPRIFLSYNEDAHLYTIHFKDGSDLISFKREENLRKAAPFVLTGGLYVRMACQ